MRQIQAPTRRQRATLAALMVRRQLEDSHQRPSSALDPLALVDRARLPSAALRVANLFACPGCRYARGTNPPVCGITGSLHRGWHPRFGGMFRAANQGVTVVILARAPVTPSRGFIPSCLSETRHRGTVIGTKSVFQ